MSNSRGLRMTPQRQTILEELRKAHSHPPADEIYERVRRRLPRISLGTIYRNLEILVEQGMVNKLEYGGFQRRYDGRLERHYHVRCARCGSVEDVEAEQLRQVEQGISRKTDYTITGHRLEFIGFCPACSNAGPGADWTTEKEKEQ